jgi:hypothetical protein
MTISIPIISEFDGGGISKAKAEFKQLEGAGAKAGFAMKKAFLPATAAVGALAVGLFDATKGAIEDAAAQDLLANTLTKATGATDAQIKANEDWISTQGKLLGVTDDELRPVLGKLARATGSVTDAQDLATKAMDIAAATGKPLATVTTALEKAYGGNLTALAKLAPEYRQMIKDGASFEEVMDAIAVTTGGAATEAANTAEGQFKRLSVALSETKESIGAALMPAVEAVLPILTNFGAWASDNPGAFMAVAGAIGAVAAAIVAVNIAMALNPFGLIAIALAGLVTGVVIAYTQFKTFAKVVRTVINGVIGYFETVANAWVAVINTLIRGYNIIPGLGDIGLLGNISLGRMRSGGPETEGLSNSRITALATGGIVTAPQIALIGEAGPEAVIPLDRMGEFGMGGGGMNITVNAGLLSSPDQVGQQIIEAIQKAQRRSGPVFAPA